MEVVANKHEVSMNFDQLVQSIQQVDSTLRDSTVKAINRMTTMRNWLIGAYIVEYEQNGVDRASYGTKLLKNLEEKINKRGLTVTTFQAARLVYRMYPQIGYVISSKYSSLTNKLSTDAELLLSRLSFTHLRELTAIEDPLVRYLPYTMKGKINVEYALGAMDRQLFVSTYQLQLPNRKELEDFIEQQRKEGFK